MPTYIVCSQVLGLSENYGALIVPLLVNPFNIIIMRTFFKSSVPLELIEAAGLKGLEDLVPLDIQQGQVPVVPEDQGVEQGDGGHAGLLVVLIVVPIACAYPFFQRYIVAGLSVGSVKG